MKTKIFYLAMYIFAALFLMTACDKDDRPSIGQTQLATPVVAVDINVYAKTIIVSWQAVENADSYYYKISGDETLYGTEETRIELRPYSKFEGGSHSITVQAVSTARPDLFSPSEWGKADFSVESTKLQSPEALDADVNKESCTVTVSWAPVANAVSYLYKIDDGEEVPVDEPGISFSLFDYAPGEHSVSVKALAKKTSPDHLASDWSEVYTFTITDEPDHARLGDFYLNDGSLLRGDSELSAELADACIGIVFYAGRHETDRSDYTRPLTAGGPVLGSTVHGYAVSLTHVPNQLHCRYDPKDEFTIWEWSVYDRWCNALMEDKNFGLTRDNGMRKEHSGAYMGTIDSEDDFNGYYNCMTMLEHIGAAKHDCCEYPALEIAINYGKKSLGWKWTYHGETGYHQDLLVKMDIGDVYDWQLSFAAPQNSSGWFLPSYGQVCYAGNDYCMDSDGNVILSVWEFMDGQFEKVKKTTTREDLKEYIRAINRYVSQETINDPNDPGWSDRRIWFYRNIHTSSEETNGYRYFQREYGYNGAQGDYVRPVLAF